MSPQKGIRMRLSKVIAATTVLMLVAAVAGSAWSYRVNFADEASTGTSLAQEALPRLDLGLPLQTPPEKTADKCGKTIFTHFWTRAETFGPRIQMVEIGVELSADQRLQGYNNCRPFSKLREFGYVEVAPGSGQPAVMAGNEPHYALDYDEFGPFIAIRDGSGREVKVGYGPDRPVVTLSTSRSTRTLDYMQVQELAGAQGEIWSGWAFVVI